jgi:6-pyruvoyltetrahydropterin/6-carboxytetrahydropterin synthase
MFRICKSYTFEAAHQLPWHDGKCARLHGHSYKLEVEVTGPIQGDTGKPDSGMVMDFQSISDVVKPIIDGLLDHYSLNEVHANPTAEHMVEWIAAHVVLQLPGVSRIRLWETATAYAEWVNGDD